MAYGDFGKTKDIMEGEPVTTGELPKSRSEVLKNATDTFKKQSGFTLVNGQWTGGDYKKLRSLVETGSYLEIDPESQKVVLPLTKASHPKYLYGKGPNKSSKTQRIRKT
jgi:hypothetical protein